MPSGTAVKPGDVIVASNGKSIQVDNTDAEGRLILADALHYASQHKPRVLLDMATLTGWCLFHVIVKMFNIFKRFFFLSNNRNFATFILLILILFTQFNLIFIH